MKNYQGDSFPVVVEWDGYTIQVGDTIIVGIVNSSGTVVLQKEITAQAEADAVQVDFTRTEMERVPIGENCIVEARVMSGDTLRYTAQKEVNFKEVYLK